MRTLEEKKRLAVWIAHSLFERGKTSGTTANISFLHEGRIYISASGTCFGTLSEEELVAVPSPGEEAAAGGRTPSKELPLHRIIYKAHPEVQAVIHTHGPNAVYWSCLEHENPRDVLGHETPYLDMKLGNVALVPYAPPGSKELFDAMRRSMGSERGYLLSHHGAVAGGLSLMNAFEAIEELEQTAWICRKLQEHRT